MTRRLKEELAAGALATILVLAIAALVSFEYSERYGQPVEWVRIGGSASEDSPVWGRLNGVWAGFNGYHLFLRFEWNTAMQDMIYEGDADRMGNQIGVYWQSRGVDVEMTIAEIDETVQVAQLRQGFDWKASVGLRVHSAVLTAADIERTDVQLELEALNSGGGILSPNQVIWRQLLAWCQITSHAETAQIPSVVTNTSHAVVIDGLLDDWLVGGNITNRIGPSSSRNEPGAISNVSCMFCSSGLAFAMSTNGSLADILASYPGLNLEATFVFGIEAFWAQEFLHEHSYNLNIVSDRTNGEIRESGTDYHLWNIDPFTILEEALAVNERQWRIGVPAEAILLSSQIQPLLDMGVVDYYALHFMVEFTWWAELGI